MGLRYYRRKSLGGGLFATLSRSGPRIGERIGPLSVSAGARGVRTSVRLAKGLSYRAARGGRRK